MKNSVIVWSSIGAVAFVVIIASGLIFFKEACRDFSEGTVEINGRVLGVDVAETTIERTAGLAGCTRIPRESGMYFPYDPPQTISFWMKGMLIPLDIVWIAQGKVVGVEAHVPTVEKDALDPAQYTPPQPVDAVLELGAGKAYEYGVVVGAPVTFTRR